MAQFQHSVSGSSKINSWRASLPAGAEIRVVFGGHWSDNPGWLILNEIDQDILHPLCFPDNSVDVIFTEHVYEHIEFVASIGFLKESLRILKPGGIFRIVCPMLDSVLSADLLGHDDNTMTYINNSLVSCFGKEHATLREEFGLDGVFAFPFEFFINSMFREHGHRFIWSAGLLARIMNVLGYHKPTKVTIGVGARRDCCIERRRRGIYLGDEWRREVTSDEIFDLESTVVEVAKKIVASLR